MLKNIRAVIFDMDGLLLDTEKLLMRCWRQAARENGFTMSREQALRLRSLAAPFAEPLLHEMFGPAFDYRAVRERRRELVERELGKHGIPVKPGAAELLKFLRGRGIRTAVATASDYERTKRYLEEAGLFALLDEIICAGMVENGKPCPDIYLYACEKLHEKPENCLALEDSPNGVLSASRAGCQVVMVPDLSEPDAELAKLLSGKVKTLRDVAGLSDWKAADVKADVKADVPLPERFLERMKELLGEEFPDFLESYQKDRAFGLRANPLKISPAELREKLPFELEPVPWAEEGFYYRETDRPGRHPFHAAGLYYIQEPSAMSAAAALYPQPGERVLDLCAAPGGKSTQTAGKMQGKGLLVSNEIVPSRAKILAQNLERLGVSNAVVLSEDSAKLAEHFPEYFDRILVDAPCSGEGMFRKDPDARKEWAEDRVRMCAERQLEILTNAVKMLKPGGRLVYSTCTFAPEENEKTVRAILKQEPELSLADSGLSAYFSQGSGCSDIRTGDMKKTVRIWPHLVRGEGHFAAAFQKSSGGNGQLPEQPARPDPKLVKPYLEFREQFLVSDPAEGREFCLFGSELYALPEQAFSLEGLRVIRPGLHLGTLKKNRFEPAHALCLALKAQDFRYTADFPADSAEIAAFLRGEPLSAEKSPAGWTAVLADGFPVGWAKSSGGTLKNHYPRGLRTAG